MPAAGRERVRAGLDGAPVLAGGDQHGVDAGHDARVVGGGAVGVELGEPRRRGDRGADLRVGLVDRARRGDGATVGQVRQDAQPGAAAGELRDAIRERFAQRVDEVRAHRVAHVDMEVCDEHAAVDAVARDDAGIETDRAAAAVGEPRHERAGLRDERVGVTAQRRRAGVGVGDLHDLDLADHHRRRDLGRKAAGPRHPRRVRRRGDDRRLLDRHRHDDVGAVDEEVHRDGERQRVRPDHVLDHVIGDVDRQRAGLDRREAIRQRHRVAQPGTPLVDAEAIEASEGERTRDGLSRQLQAVFTPRRGASPRRPDRWRARAAFLPLR